MGADVRVLTRDESKAQGLNDAGVGVVAGNMENPWDVMWGDGTHALISSRSYQIYSFIPRLPNFLGRAIVRSGHIRMDSI